MDSELSFRTRGNFQLDMFSQDPINNSHILALVLPLYKMGNTKSDFKVNSTVHQRCGTHLNRNIGDWSHNPRQSLWTPLYRWCFGQLQSHWNHLRTLFALPVSLMVRLDIPISNRFSKYKHRYWRCPLDHS